MAGIAPQPADAPNPDQQQGPEEVGDEEGLAPNVSPEEQQQYEEFVLSGMALIYDKKDASAQAQVRPGIMKLLDDDPSDLKAILKNDQLEQFSPLVAIAATTVVVTLEILKIAGPEDMPDDAIILHGGVAILQELSEIWMRRYKKELGEDDVHRALSMAADLYREVGADQGLVDENALKDQFSALVKADKEGRLADISPDLAGINKAAEMNMQQGDEPEPQDNPAEEQQEPAQ
jgi:hypothetical protein